MGTITISLHEDIEKNFRDTVKKQKGVGKGKLGEAIGEALLDWTEKKNQDVIAKRMMAIMEKGFHLGKVGKWKREELYER